MSDWAEKLYRDVFVPKDPKPVKVPENGVLCPKCHGTGIGGPGETYMEQGGPIFGCSEYNGYGWIPK